MDNKPNIMIVDDVQLNREMLVDILGEKYDVYQACNGQQAIEMLKNDNRMYRMVLLDLIMPVVDGYGVLEYMSESGKIGEIPVIIITGESSNKPILKAYSMGAVDVFQKPYTAEIMLHRIDNILKIYDKIYKDPLTGGHSRKAFIKEVESIMSANADTDFSLLYFNIKDFKAINELLGTSGGDEVISYFYNDIIMDKINPIIATRLEADHYACLVKTSEFDAEQVANLMESSVVIKDKKIRIFCIFGVYHITDKTVSATRMIDRAKIAKKHILDESVKPYSVYVDDMKKDYVNQAEALAEFEDGIANNEFKIYYQPVIEAATGHLASAEALVRWVHPEKGFVSPGAFIPALEKNGHITRLDRYVLSHVAKKMDERIREGKVIIPVSVNLSWMDFYDDTMTWDLTNLLSDKKINKAKIRLEVTETSYVALEQNRGNLLSNLRNFGATILLDDFGSGYSSFGMLDEYDFDILKIDMSFVRKIEEKEKSRIIIKGLIDMCHEMGMKVVAEGAENEAQVQFLKDNGCDYIQGYYYSKPLPEDEFVEFIARYEAAGMIGSSKI